MKKRSERCKHCALAVVRRSQKFCPAADPLRCKESTLAVARHRQKFRSTTDPFPGARDGQNLISWRWSLPLPINPVWWRSMHAIFSYHGNRPTNTHTPHKHTNQQTEPITIHCTAKLSAQCKKNPFFDGQDVSLVKKHLTFLLVWIMISIWEFLTVYIPLLATPFWVIMPNLRALHQILNLLI